MHGNLSDSVVTQSSDRGRTFVIGPTEVSSVDNKTGETRKLAREGAALSGISKDGTKLALLDRAKGEVVLWDSVRNTQVTLPLLNKESSAGTALSKDGKTHYQAFKDGRIATVAAGKAPVIAPAPRAGTYADIHFSEDARYIRFSGVSSQPQGRDFIVERESGREIPLDDCPRASTSCEAGRFLPSSPVFVRRTGENLEVRDLDLGRSLTLPLRTERPLEQELLSRDRETLTLQTGSEVVTVNLRTGKVRRIPRSDSGRALGAQAPLGFTDGGSSLVIPDAESLSIVDIRSGKSRKLSLPGRVSAIDGKYANFAYSADGKSAAVHLTVNGQRKLATIDLKSGAVKLGAPLSDQNMALEYAAGGRLLLQRGLALTVLQPRSTCVDSSRRLERLSCLADHCQKDSPKLTESSAIEPLASFAESQLCQSPYRAEAWASRTRIPASGDIPLVTARALLLSLQKPGALDPERHLPALLAILNSPANSPFWQTDGDLVLHALGAIAGTHPRIHDQLLALYPELEKLTPKAEATCRTAEEAALVRAGLERYLRAANGSDRAIAREALKGIGPESRASNGALFVTVGSENPEHKTAPWGRKLCEKLHAGLQLANDKPTDMTCASRDLEPDLAARTEAERRSGAFARHVSLLERKDGGLLLDTEEWRTTHPSAPARNRWNISLLDAAERDAIIQRLTRGMVDFDENRLKFEEAALIHGLDLSKRLYRDPKTGEFFDRKPKLHKVGVEEAVKVFQEEGKEQKHYLRATVELATIMGITSAVYYSPLYSETTAMDSDYKDFKSGMKHKLLSLKGWRFDDNDIVTNVGHIKAGTFWYLFCSQNNLSTWESAFCAAVGAFIWENVEYREVTSPGDLVTTTVGGIATGAAITHHGKFFSRGADKGLNRYLGWLFGGMQRVHNMIDKAPVAKSAGVDKNGFPTDAWHQFELSTGVGVSKVSGEASQGAGFVGLTTEILDQARYNKAGQNAELLKDVPYSKIIVDASLGTRGLSDFHTMMRTMLAGYYKQDIRKDENDLLQGYNLLIGPTTAVDYASRTKGKDTLNEGYSDMNATVNVLGATVVGDIHSKGVHARLDMTVSGDYALIQSLAVEDYAAAHGREGLRNVIKLHDYYHGWGMTAQASGSVEYKDLSVSAGYKKQFLDQIRWGDRFKEKVTQDPRTSDTTEEMKVGVGYRLTPAVSVRAEGTRLKRKSSMGEITKGETTHTALGKLVLTF